MDHKKLIICFKLYLIVDALIDEEK